MKVLVIDVGGTHVKILASGREDARKLASGPDLTAQQMVDVVRAAASDWDYEAVTVGYPGPVVQGQIHSEPKNLGPGWVGFDFAAALGRPVKLINDAAMQALGSYDGGKMLFLGLGTGLGSALVVEDVVAPLELAHLPYKKKRTYEDYVGERGLELFGKKKWLDAVNDIVARFRDAFVADYIVLGGGNSKKLPVLPPFARLGDNRNAFVGGLRLWEVHETGRERYGNA